ncbi:MAG: STAS domain-containing protein [Magnetococcales bacterium]|nr:STAS domain-containing protein [Magnetococcales bacterium]
MKIEESGAGVTVHLPHEFTFKQYREFRACYQGRAPGVAYEIDFRQVKQMDTSALGMLLLLRSHCGENQACIRLVHCNPAVRELLRVVMLDTLFCVADSVAA